MLSPTSMQFLADLTANNNRDWFLENKKSYDQYKHDYYTMVQALLDEMKRIDTSLEPLEVKNCIFRINRDIRFSKDKTPYKNHLGIWMSPGSKGENNAGYYLQISPESCFIAGGLHTPEAPELKKVRREIAFFYDELLEITEDKQFKKLYKALDKNDSLKTAPKDFDKDHPAIEQLKLKSFTVTLPFDPSEVHKKSFVKWAADRMAVIKPLNDFINRALHAGDN